LPPPIYSRVVSRRSSHLRRLRVSIRHAKIAVADGVMYNAWTFDGRVPGPVLRGTEGDTVDFTLVNEAPMPHSLDFHAAEIAPLPDSTRTIDWEKLLGLAPDYVVFNGREAEYAHHPIPVRVGERLRLYVVNAGPNRFSAFHVVGAIFDRVYMDGSLAHPLEGVQTVTVPVGGGAIFEARLVEAGTYPFVSHAFADATKGAVGMFKAR
jgi:FtsP/CotA-like multicopper oxidase with cupredoxin domain